MRLSAKSFVLLPFAAFVFLGVNLPVALAQQDQDAESSSLEEIVVTARKREESLQDVAISISVVSGEFLQESNIAKLENLAPTIPNFHHSESVAGNDQLFIRGIGSGVNFGFENSVGQVFDGFFFGRSRFGRALFMDLERVEILKGPQGALIGKNTTAGAINITSAKPTDEFMAYVIPTWEFEGDEGYSLEGALSGPFDDTVKGRLAFRWEDKDGYYDNLVTGEEEMSRQEIYLRGILDFDVSDTFRASVLYQYGKQERRGRNRELGKCTPAFAAVIAPTGDDCEFNYTNSLVRLENGVRLPSVNDTESNLAGLTLDWDTALGTVTSLTGFAKYNLSDDWDSDLLSPEAVTLHVDETWDQMSQEIRLVSTGDNAIDYIVGAYYLDTDHSTRFRLDFNQNGPVPIFPVLPPALRARNNRFTDEDGQTLAGFAELTWHVAERWDLIGGIRYTDEDKDAHNREFATVVYTDTPRPQPPGGPAANSHDVFGDRSVSQWTPNGVIQFRPTDNAMLYASVSSGFKGGGFDNMLSGNQAYAEATFEFDDEEVLAYEVGGKFDFPEARFQLNAAMFYTDISDVQVSTLLAEGAGLLFKVGNAASATTQGVEVDFRWLPIERLRISGAVGYLNAEFDEYPDAPCYSLQTVAQGCVNGVQDLSGGELQYSPDWKVNLDGSYTWPVSSALEFTVFTRVYYTDDQALALDLDPQHYQDSFAKWDASLILASQDKRWRVSLIGQNLTDELTANFANDGAGPPGASSFFFASPPRSIALQARIEY